MPLDRMSRPSPCASCLDVGVIYLKFQPRGDEKMLARYKQELGWVPGFALLVLALFVGAAGDGGVVDWIVPFLMALYFSDERAHPGLVRHGLQVWVLVEIFSDLAVPVLRWFSFLGPLLALIGSRLSSRGLVTQATWMTITLAGLLRLPSVDQSGFAAAFYVLAAVFWLASPGRGFVDSQEVAAQ